MSHVVWNSFTKEAFDRNWNDFLMKYGIGDNKWLSVNKVAPRYILERWSKNIKRRHTHFKSNHDELVLEPRSRRFDYLVFWSQNVCEFASESEELTVILHRVYDNAMAEMQEYKAKSKEKCSLSHEDTSLENINELQSPPRVRIR
ncbi:hypothetical protein Ahy_B06g082218 [Arachis hypogaea]|uniref:Protein FAR1-RELATED SEQUENCE n=1 Tax=Arachis hypogaea TaxID=3818 RepID=A0A444YN29_ARAHY|nr:hypothetical protein Ahy_B06g082218 [Arachis hypogaea]